MSSSDSSSLDSSGPNFFEELENEDNEFIGTMMNTIQTLQQHFAHRQPPIHRRPNRVLRDRVAAAERLENDYVRDNPVFNDAQFRRRYRMSKNLFLRLVSDMENTTTFFTQRSDGRMKSGFTALQKCTAAIRQLTYGTTPDSFDEYLQISDRTTRDCVQKFCKNIIRLYGREYLRRPTFSDIQLFYHRHHEHYGFPGMLGSLDCTHWEWFNCPVAWRGQYMRGDHPRPTVILEEVASQDLWFWHAFFGPRGSNNDLSVLVTSPIFNNVYNGIAPGCPFQANGNTYKHGYYLVDGIYLEWATLMKSYTHPNNEKRIRYKTSQEAARKDVERAFGRLKKKWHIIQNLAQAWHPAKIRNIMYVCVILHNMILKDDGRALCQDFHENELPTIVGEFNDTIFSEVHSIKIHNMLKPYLVEHISGRFIPNVDRHG